MTAMAATEMILFIGDGASPVESFTPLEGVQITRLEIQHEAPLKTAVRQSLWPQRHSATTSRAVLNGEGVFTASASELMLQQMASGAQTRNIKLQFGSGDEMQGAFMMQRFERFGEIGDVVRYRFALVSSGQVSLG